MTESDNREDGDPSLSGYQLCGYLQAVLSFSPPKPVAGGSPCTLFADRHGAVGLRSDTGVCLLPIPQRQSNFEGGDVAESSVRSPASKRRRRSAVGVVNGKMSVVHLLHALASSGCLKVKAVILGVSVKKEVGEARAVVLVDVYLPIEIWSGWQFPRHGARAASLFKHVRCDWNARRSLLKLDEDSGVCPPINDEHIWRCCDCNVLGCKIHNITFGADDRSSFDLHEIFKSLPAAGMEEVPLSSRIKPQDASVGSGIWNATDDILFKVLVMLGPKDLSRVSATCHHLRALAVSVMPCMKLKLFPHQEAAVDWMLKREHNAELLPHPLYLTFLTEDGFSLYMNAVSGHLSTMAPTVSDFRGGMFCDEPGLGKTVTALSLILKTHGTLADPPDGVDVVWCMHDADRKCGYYEVSADKFTPANFMSSWKRFIGQKTQREKICLSKSPLELGSSGVPERSGRSTTPKFMDSEVLSVANVGTSSLLPAARILRCTRSLSRVKRNLFDTYEAEEGSGNDMKASELDTVEAEVVERNADLPISNNNKKRHKKDANSCEFSETWAQCDACGKWRKLSKESILDAKAAWFCSMNADSLHQSCADPEEPWKDKKRKITYFPGFYTKGTPQGKEQNVSFFTNVLKEHSALLKSNTMKALTWLANLPDDKLIEMETVGLRRPAFLDVQVLHRKYASGYHKIFQAFGLVRKIKRGTSRWLYPCTLDNLEFDLAALRIALTKRLDLIRLYLSGATLIVVPANLIDHWKTQIQKHVSPGQLRVFDWTDNKKPSAHNLAWDYDIVITTFSRLSAEWGLHKRSILMQVHWLRIILDEGHTLGSNLNLTNKLQMAISLAAKSRWILTGTPTPNTPISQVGHLQPMLTFLHEQAYGNNQESWEAGILKPFEAQMEDGRSRLLALLRRIMISARKEDLRNIPPCIKKVTFIHFSEEHARSYNELVVTVRRNILMADWNDPSHVESLLNPKQWKSRRNTIRNVRLSCCVAGHIKVRDAGQDIQETMDILVQQGLDPQSEEYAFIRSSLLNGCSCFRCKDWCRLPVITPCRHLLCLDCVALDREKCTYPGCSKPYLMQSPEKLTRPENPDPKWPVPKDLIELQPSYEQDNWDPDWQSTSSSKVAYLVDRLKTLQKNNLCSSQESKTHPNGLPCEILPEKVIVFSQFLEHIHVIEQQLTFAGIRYTGLYNPMPSSKKVKSLLTFQRDPSCTVLLMDGSAALGLDLSFVTLVFLMEPIWDRSMEEQVISRAHRMGATRPIYVETLAMRATIEEQMLELLQDANMSRRMIKQESETSNCEGTRANRTLHDFAESNYLSQLTFVHTKA